MNLCLSQEPASAVRAGFGERCILVTTKLPVQQSKRKRSARPPTRQNQPFKFCARVTLPNGMPSCPRRASTIFITCRNITEWQNSLAKGRHGCSFTRKTDTQSHCRCCFGLSIRMSRTAGRTRLRFTVMPGLSHRTTRFRTALCRRFKRRFARNSRAHALCLYFHVSIRSSRNRGCSPA